MTDTTAGRGGVGIRLFVEGGALVRRTFNQIGDSGRKMWSEIALGERSANPAIRALSLGVGEAKGAIDGLTSRAGAAGVALGAFGFAGIALAAVLGTVAIATQGAFQAMEGAAVLTDTAERIGLGVEALQEWRYVADEAGVDTAKLEAGMEKLNGVLGRFKLGIADGKLKPVFEELGITKAQLDNVTTADQLLTLLASTLGQIDDRAKQVALARSLGIEELLPILRLGSDELERLKNEASELGFVMGAETVAELDKADRAMERAGQQFRVIRDTAVAPLATIFADLTSEIAKSSVEISNMTSQLPAWQRAIAQFAQWVPGVGGLVRNVASNAKGAFAPGANQDAFEDFDIWSLDLPGVLRPGGGGFAPLGHSSGGGGASARAEKARLEREAEQRRQREIRANERLARADDDIARGYDRGFLSIEGKAAYEIADLERERAARLREIARDEEEYVQSKGLRGLTEAEAQLLRAKQDELTGQKKAAVEWEERRALAARRLRDEEDSARAALELLDIESQMASTARERVRIEREILLASIEMARKRRAAELENDPELDDAERRRRLSVFDRGNQRRVELFDHREEERLKEQFKSYGREVVQAIEDGRIGEYIGDQLKQRLLDGALEQLFNLLKGGFSGLGGARGGGSGSGLGGWVQGAMKFASSFFGGGRAAGGGTRAGQFYTTVEHGRPELFMIGGQGHVTSAAETVRMLQDSMGGGGGSGSAPVVQQRNVFDFKGAVVTEDLIAQANSNAQEAAQNAFNGAREVVPSDRARTDRYTRGRR